MYFKYLDKGENVLSLSILLFLALRFVGCIVVAHGRKVHPLNGPFPLLYAMDPDEDHPWMGSLRPTRWISPATDL